MQFKMTDESCVYVLLAIVFQKQASQSETVFHHNKKIHLEYSHCFSLLISTLLCCLCFTADFFSFFFLT